MTPAPRRVHPESPSPYLQSAMSIRSVDFLLNAHIHLLTSRQDVPLLTWLEYRDDYLDALLCHDGRGRYMSSGCAVCGKPDPAYRCRDCTGRDMVCEGCIVSRHKGEPLHVIEVCAGPFCIVNCVLRWYDPGLAVNALPQDVLKFPQCPLPAWASP